MTKFSGLLVLASLSPIVVAIGCANGGAPSDEPEVTTKVAALTGTLSADFEDGTTQGWFPFGSPTVASSTDVANTGTHSLLTTNRTSGFMGPGTSLTGQLTAAANYHVSVAARLQAGQAATGLKVTVMRSFADGTSAFDAVVPSTQVTDQAWVTLQGNYSFASSTNSSGSALSGIILYVESDSATASYYIDTFSLTQAAPPPISVRLRGRHGPGLVPVRQPDGRQLDRYGVHGHAQPPDDESHGQLHGSRRQHAGEADQGCNVSGDRVGAPGHGPAGEHADRDVPAHADRGQRGVRPGRLGERHRPGVGDHDRHLLVHHRQLGPHLLCPDRVRERVVLHRRRQHRAGRAASRPARQHRGRQQHVREPDGRGVEVAHRRRDRRGHQRRRARRQLQPADQQPHRHLPGAGLRRHQRDVQRVALRRLAVGQARARPGRHAAAREPRSKAGHRDGDLPPGRRQHDRHRQCLGAPAGDVQPGSGQQLAHALRRVGQRDPLVLHRRLQHHLRPSSRRRAQHPVGVPVGRRVLPDRRRRGHSRRHPAERARIPPQQALQQHHLGQRHEVGRDRGRPKGTSPSRRPTPRSPSPRPTTCTSVGTRWSGTTRHRPGSSTTPTAPR